MPGSIIRGIAALVSDANARISQAKDETNDIILKVEKLRTSKKRTDKEFQDILDDLGSVRSLLEEVTDR